MPLWSFSRIWGETFTRWCTPDCKCQIIIVKLALPHIDIVGEPLTPKRGSFLFPPSLRPLTQKTFGLFWVGAFLSSIGFWIQSVGQGWQVLQLTNSVFLLGLVTFAATLPTIVLALFGGVVVDRMSRRHLLLDTQIVYMSTALLLGILTTFHWITVWQIIVLALINGICSFVGFPAWQAYVSDLVPPNS